MTDQKHPDETAEGTKARLNDPQPTASPAAIAAEELVDGMTKTPIVEEAKTNPFPQQGVKMPLVRRQVEPTPAALEAAAIVHNIMRLIRVRDDFGSSPAQRAQSVQEAAMALRGTIQSMIERVTGAR